MRFNYVTPSLKDVKEKYKEAQAHIREAKANLLVPKYSFEQGDEVLLPGDIKGQFNGYFVEAGDHREKARVMAGSQMVIVYADQLRPTDATDEEEQKNKHHTHFIDQWTHDGSVECEFCGEKGQVIWDSEVQENLQRRIKGAFGER